MEAANYRPDVLITFGSPMSDHLVGLALKERLGLPWIAHFSDPWVDNPFAPSDPVTRAINRRLERKVISAAEKVVFTSEETVHLVMKKYEVGWRRKVQIVPHAFDSTRFRDRQPGNKNGKITIRYLGDFYGPRTPAPLFNALRLLLTVNPGILDDVCFEIVGTLGDLQLESFGLDSLPAGLVTLSSPVSYLDSLSLMASASGLLVIDAPAAESVFLPSKLIDYLGAGRPVFGITPPGTAASLIRKLGGWVCDPTDIKQIAEELTQFLNFIRSHQNEGTAKWGDASVRTRYEAPLVAKHFTQVVYDVVNNRS
jgi:glycosyltransferase involved in cell wall biosynthesis